MTDAAAPRLLVVDPQGRRFIALDKPLTTLGRRSESDVCVAHVGISRLHAEITVEDGEHRIRDCGSRFGTFVNDERTNERPLRPGDRIRLGEAQDTEIVFLVGDDTPSQERSAIAAASELRHMAGLLEGLRALGSTRVLEDVLGLVLDAAIDVTGAERGFIMLANDGGTLEFKLARARGRITLSGQTFATSRKVPEAVFASGQAMFVDDLADEAVAGQHMGTVALGIRHVLCTPLRLVQFVERRDQGGEQRTVGVLYLDSRERGSLQSASTRAALDTLSAEAAVAIENARLYREALERAKLEQDLKVAAAIQQALLPPAGCTGPFFTVAGASAACRAVGGDFFDYVDLPGGRFGFILGDVAGKGSPAALLAAAVLGMFSAEAGYQNRAAGLLARLNHGLFRRRVEARFVTTFYAMLAADGALTYANGGHNPPVLSTADGPRRLETGGLVLGLFEQAEFEEETLQLAPGDTILVFSDGVTEAENEEGEQFGDERLLATIAASRGASAQALLDRVLEDVRAFCGRALPTDDVTALVVRYEG
jgi:sigma-B regulation protein RsbU (phosphoserine phosphatase)